VDSLRSIGGDFRLPRKAQDGGWDAFDHYASDDLLPKTLPSIKSAVDNLFVSQLKSGVSFRERLLGKLRGKLNLYAELRRMQQRCPNRLGLVWRNQKGSLSPQSQEDLRKFIKVLWAFYSGENPIDTAL